MLLIGPRLDAVTCDARSIRDKTRELFSRKSSIYLRIRDYAVYDDCSRRGLRVGMVRPSKRGGGGGFMVLGSQHDPNTKFTRGRQSRVVR